jgi:hypothetical protein
METIAEFSRGERGQEHCPGKCSTMVETPPFIATLKIANTRINAGENATMNEKNKPPYPRGSFSFYSPAS